MRYLLLLSIYIAVLASFALAMSDGGMVDDARLDGCTASLASHIDPTEAGGTHDYMNFIDGGGSGTEGDEDLYVVTRVGVAHSLYCWTATAPGAGNDDWKISLEVDSSSSALIVSIDEAATTDSNTTDRVTLAVGEKLNLLVDSSGGDANPTGSTDLVCTMCVVY